MRSQRYQSSSSASRPGIFLIFIVTLLAGLLTTAIGTPIGDALSRKYPDKFDSFVDGCLYLARIVVVALVTFAQDFLIPAVTLLLLMALAVWFGRKAWKRVRFQRSI